MTTTTPAPERSIAPDFQVTSVIRNAGRWCPPCEVGWRTPEPTCWNCGQEPTS